MKKSTLIALAVFGALALVWALTREREVSEGVHRLSLATVNADALTTIEVGPVTLQSVPDGGWTVSSGGTMYAADVSLAQQLAREVATLQAPDFVTERTERQAELEVDSAKGVVLKARTEKMQVRDLVIGKASKTGGVYVRQSASNEVFSSNGGLGYQVHRALRDWRDKHIPVVRGTDEVTHVQVTPASGTAFALVKNDAWALEGAAPAGFRFDAEVATRFVTQVSTLTAQDFVDADEPMPTTITLGLKSGATRVLHVGGKRADGLYALKIDGEQQVWLLPAFVGAALNADLDGVRDMKLLRFEPKDVREWSVLGAKGKVVVRRDGTEWKLVEPKSAPPGVEFDSHQVDAQLSRLQSLRGTRVGAGKFNSTPTIELALNDGTKSTLRFGAKTGDDFEVVGSDGLVFMVPASQKTWLDSGIELFKKPPPMPSMNGIQGLDQLPPDIRAKLEAQLRQQQVR